MRAKLLLVDVGIAIVVALIVLAITPGLAVAAAIAVVTLGACAVSFRRDTRRRRRARTPRRRKSPVTRVSGSDLDAPRRAT